MFKLGLSEHGAQTSGKEYQRNTRLAVLLILLPIFGGGDMCSAGTITFTDGTFNLADWNSTQTAGNGSLATSQQPNGGNPGTYLRVDHLDFTYLFWATHYFAGATYNPSVSGAVASVNWSIDEYAILNFSGIGVGTAAAIRQGGQDFYYVPTLNVNSGSSWLTLMNSVPLTAADFTSNSAPGAHPDFSAAGGEMSFGFVTANDNQQWSTSRAAGFDNWRFDVIQQQDTGGQVPEPSTILMVGGAGLGLAWLRRRQKR
jgi:hypothetical protein